jgi:hypothetical protein
MKNIKKNASIKSKVKGKETNFNVDLNYSEEYDSFNIKVKKGEGFLSYTDSLQGLPLEVIQKLNEMLEEVLIKAGSEYEMKEHKMSNGGDFQAGVYAKGGSLQAHGIEVGDTFVRTISGGIQKVKDKNGKIVYVDLSTGERDSQPPLPFADGGGIGIEEDIDMSDDRVLRVRKPAMPEKKLTEQEWAEKHNAGAYEYMGKEKMMFGGDILSNLKNIFTKDVVYETDEYGNFCVILKPLKEQRKYENIEDEVFYKMPEKYLEKEDVGDFFVKQSNVFLPNAQLSFEEIERKFGVKLSNKAKEIYTDKSKAKEKSDIEQLIQQYKVAVESRNYVYASKLKNLIVSVRESKKFATGGALVGNQKRIDMNHNGKIDAEDFKLLRSSMNGAWRNERKHVNHSEDYEVRYAKPRPNRTGYKGKRKFGDGGGISNFERLSRVVAKNYEGKRVKPKYQKEYGKVYSKLEAKEVGNKVAGKVKLMKKAESGAEVKKGNRGGVMLLAKKIRRDGEKWTDAVKRASQELK